MGFVFFLVERGREISSKFSIKFMETSLLIKFTLNSWTFLYLKLFKILTLHFTYFVSEKKYITRLFELNFLKQYISCHRVSQRIFLHSDRKSGEKRSIIPIFLSEKLFRNDKSLLLFLGTSKTTFTVLKFMAFLCQFGNLLSIFRVFVLLCEKVKRNSFLILEMLFL